jgi:hypothetical protein
MLACMQEQTAEGFTRVGLAIISLGGGVKRNEERLIRIPSTLVPNWSSSFIWVENNKSAY